MSEPTTVGAPPAVSDNEAAAITSRKHYERFLRSHGFSRSQAKGLAAKGWSSIREESAEDDSAETLALLKRIEEAVTKKTET